MGESLDVEPVRVAARAFIGEAFDALAKEHVVPTPIYHPYVAVGRDYYGDTIRALPHYGPLEQALEAAHPERFAEPLKRPHGEFASTYMFSFLEACIAGCGRSGSFDPRSPEIEESLDEMLDVLAAERHELVCVRHVGHLTSTSGDEIEIGDVTVIPERAHGSLTERVQREIVGAAQAWNREDPRPYAPPHSLLIARDLSDDPDIEAVTARLQTRLGRFLLLARLLSAGTVRSNCEMIGPTTRVARTKPRLSISSLGLFEPPVRRTVRLDASQAGAFAMLGDAIDAAEVKREGMVATSSTWRSVSSTARTATRIPTSSSSTSRRHLRLP